MRIDYSEPRQSYTVPNPSRHRPKSGVSSATLIALVVCGGLLFGSGFGVGWYFSQQASKKAFRAAMEQQSLETGAKGGLQPPPAATPDGPAQQSEAAPAAQPGTAPVPSHPELPLSFFDNLPKGQKNTVLGSGINEKPKPAPQPPVTAPVPQSAPQQPVEAPKNVPAQPAAKPIAKPAPKPTGYLVQVASYSNRKDAETLKSRLSSRGYAAKVSETTLEGKTWYRVRIGRHLDKESATTISNQLMMGAKIVPDQDE
ncbi:SPOR domain-containing protein [Trichlorobacter sp.]|uniref:SPOR domain-containing protein n=1 Tax=Trichlorobacter sp. TaxID=2911007 RepID=UPI002A364641|nr:SPOR domain-containing protein [Trichlorobacter sp.]MDY0385248.1 SPOR domain-containing protein [Trichlorobacter sp.]